MPARIRTSFYLILILFSNCFATDLKLGATLPLSGDYATYGEQIQNGIELALEDNKQVKVEMFYEDIPTPGANAISAARKLVNVNNVNGIVGNFWNPAIPIMAPVLNKNKIVTFHTAAADDLILDAGDYIFSTNARVRDEAKKLVKYAKDTLKAKTASIVYAGTTFGEQYAKHYEKNFVKNGGKILSNDLIALSDTDYRAVITKIRAKKPDVILSGNFGTNLGRLLKQGRENGLTQKFLTVYETEDPSVLTSAKGRTENVFFYVAEPTANNQVQENFIKRYVKKYGERPGILAKNAYDATSLCLEYFAICEGSAVCTRNSLYNVKNYPGVSGTFSIDEDGAATKNFILKTIANIVKTKSNCRKTLK